MKAFVVFNETGFVIGCYKSEKEAIDNHGEEINLDMISHPNLSFDELKSLVLNGIQ
jgi:hypothetical protein